MKYLVFLIGLQGCGFKGIEPTYTTAHGFGVYCEDACFPQAEVEAATDAVIKRLTTLMPYKYSKTEIDETLEYYSGQNSISFVAQSEGPIGSCANEADPYRACKGFECEGSESGWCAGMTSFDYMSPTTHTIVAKEHDCVSAGALVHELIHVFQNMMLGEVDYEHAMSPYWSNACDPSTPDRYECWARSVDVGANAEVCDTYCDYMCFDYRG